MKRVNYILSRLFNETLLTHFGLELFYTFGIMSNIFLALNGCIIIVVDIHVFYVMVKNVYQLLFIMFYGLVSMYNLSLSILIEF